MAPNSGFSVTVKGLDRAIREMRGLEEVIEDGLRPGFERAGTIVEGSWKTKVHKVTRKYAGSIGHKVEGRGIDTKALVGPQPGFKQSRGYSESDTRHWKKPRRGRNTGDPREYAVYEEMGTRYRPAHPAAEPALRENAQRVVGIVRDALGAALNRRMGR
jgi:HK97 gp10 family phage protein